MRDASADWIVFAWHTPDYRNWADGLIANLNARAIPHDVVEAPKLNGGWEANTMAKPRHLLSAMDRHPDKTIILLDVDCIVRGDLAPLLSIPGDVGFYTNARWHKRRGVLFSARSGTVVIRPTAAARRYVEAWVAAAREAQWGDVDQSPQVFAMARATGTTFTILDFKWCATEAEVPDAPIAHIGAHNSMRRLTRMERILGRWLDRLRRALPAYALRTTTRV